MVVITLGSSEFNPIILEDTTTPVEGAPIVVVDGGEMTAMIGETDPIFNSWDKHTGITIHPSQIIPDASDIVPLGLTVATRGLDNTVGGTQLAYNILTWTAITSSTFDHYYIRYTKTGLSNYTYLTSYTNSILISGLIPNTSYNFAIASVNTSGVVSAFSSPAVTSTTLADTTAPENVTGQNVTAGIESAILIWDANTDLDLASYNIYRNTVNNSATSSIVANVSTNRYVDVNLTGGIEVFYWIKAKDTSGNLSSSYSDYDSCTPTIAFSQTELQTILGTTLENISLINPADGFIKENTVGTLQLDTNSVLRAISLNNAVQAAQLDVAAIAPDGTIRENAVGTLQIDEGAVTHYTIANDAIRLNNLSAGSVTGPAIESSAITAAHIGAGEIIATHILTGALEARHITSFNFIVSAGTFTDDAPIDDEVAWISCKVVYNGVEYSIDDDNCNTDDKYIYW